MVLDTSAIIAAITNEPDGPRYRAAMRDADNLLISAVAVLETRIVLFARLGPQAVELFDELLRSTTLVVVPFDDEMSKGAFEAFRQYGKGSGHPAQLNIVDCAVYALAKSRSQPLLFKGGDFGRTDIAIALI
ncbi:type II toxin-antitoxin system VapC family toxin [Bradyrhizobium sp. 186]|uniref:type II toxin-antitoxin system VapC family toxin n=1 Tax=Bradyrhizobium sp. 186 TaxID=2782654 RepID=UPI002001AB42|nr:type II toxin-antitoxin system VapC family toxin [Bradyrhizobium sp. 186]UPK31726.1 type II toxin-antitoxin system VapC family toxin [Bradyrhizobium sp. 186]